ncbi:hypothetical protein GCM10022206_32630 [Streptomyces chiangmaiensis]
MDELGRLVRSTSQYDVSTASGRQKQVPGATGTGGGGRLAARVGAVRSGIDARREPARPVTARLAGRVEAPGDAAAVQIDGRGARGGIGDLHLLSHRPRPRYSLSTCGAGRH